MSTPSSFGEAGSGGQPGGRARTEATALGDIVVVEISGGRYEYATKALGDMGATVLTIEPPDGNPSRRVGPFVGDIPDAERSLRYWHHNTSKRSVIADLTDPQGQSDIIELIRGADVLATSHSRDELAALGLDDATLRTLAEDGLVVARICPFGPGPWEQLLTSDLVQLALGGVAGVCGYDDREGRPPVAPTGGHAEYLASLMAAIAILAAIPVARGERRLVEAEIAAHDAIAVSTEMGIPFWEFQRVNVRRQTGRHAHPTHTAKWNHRCADGKYLSALPLYLDAPRFTDLVSWMKEHGAEQDLADERYLDPGVRRIELDHIVAVISDFFAELPVEEAYRGAQARRLPWAPINAPGELLDFPHLTDDRGAFPAVEVAAISEEVRFAGAPYQFSRTPWRASTPPTLGEFTPVHEGNSEYAITDR